MATAIRIEKLKPGFMYLRHDRPTGDDARVLASASELGPRFEGEIGSLEDNELSKLGKLDK